MKSVFVLKWNHLFTKNYFKKKKNKLLLWIYVGRLSDHLWFNGRQKFPVAGLNWNPWTYIFFIFNRQIKRKLRYEFQSKVAFAIKAVKIIPNKLEQCKAEDEGLVKEYYNEDLPSPSTFQQKLKLWKRYWADKNEKPRSFSQTIFVKNVTVKM